MAASQSVLRPQAKTNFASVVEVVRLERDWTSVRRARASALPGVASPRHHGRVGHAFFGENAFQRGEPMPVVGFARIGIAGRLRFFDFFTQYFRPLFPGE